jgi:hypothetical protein
LKRLAESEQLRLQAEQEQEELRRRVFADEASDRRTEPQAPQSQETDADSEPLAAPVESAAPEAVEVPTESVLAATAGTPRMNRLRPAMAMAACTSVLLTAALLAYGNRRPASPVPLSVLQRSTVVEQKVPFGPAVVPAATNSVLPLPPPSSRAENAVTLPPEHHGHSDFRRVRVGRHEVDYVSEDVTVRHFGDPYRRQLLRHPAADDPVSANSGVKQISDMQ